MGTWQISADLLARSRFVVSPRIEAAAALSHILRPSDPMTRAFSRAHRESFEAMLDEHPRRRALVDFSWRPGWIADWLSLPPIGHGRSFEAELEDVVALGDKWVRADLRETHPGAEFPRSLTRPGVADEAAAVLAWVWNPRPRHRWARRERVLHADIVSRTTRLATHGWAAAPRDLGRDREWLGDGHLRINRYDLPSRDLEEASDLFFVPAHGTATWVGWHIPSAMPSTTRSVRRARRDRRRARRRRPGTAHRGSTRQAARRTRVPFQHDGPRRSIGYAAGLGGRPPDRPASVGLCPAAQVGS